MPKRYAMLWEVEIQPTDHDLERQRVCEEYALLTHSGQGSAPVQRAARGYLLEGNLNRETVERLVAELLADPLVETSRIEELSAASAPPASHHALTVLLKPGVTDPVAMSVLDAARDLGIS